MPLDRQAVVSRHAVQLNAPDPQHVLTVGNGDFGYTADITGMQTFRDYHDPVAAIGRGEVAINTATMSSWGWHSMPNPEGYVLDDAMTEYPTSRGPVRYPDRFDMTAAARGQLADDQRPGAWLNANPHRLDLGRIGLELRATPDAEPEIDPTQLIEPVQELDLWGGRITSRFGYAGQTVTVDTVADPDSATVAFRIVTPLLADGRATVHMSFPYASDGFFQTDDWHADPGRHQTQLTAGPGGTARIDRRLDNARYTVHISARHGRVIQGTTDHEIIIEADGTKLDLVVRFDPDPDAALALDRFEAIAERAAGAWQQFWTSGAAVDLSDSEDPRANELERRIVVSQYLTRVHCTGTLPPAETGLVTNSWQGKFHLEMHLWHAAHFAAWGRPELLQPSLHWYRSTLPVARATARRQGYPGARWPKQVGPDGRESPDPTGSLLVWQQPHILYLLELVRRALPAEQQAELADSFADVVQDTADFMAAFPTPIDDELHLGPPVMPAQEFYEARTTVDPTFELAYWWWGLEIAQQWRERATHSRNEAWTDVQDRLAAPRAVDGRYVAVASSNTLRRDDHPALLAAFGLVPPTPLIEPDTMNATLDDVLADWDWPTAWGWDFPMIAMTATRLGRPGTAVDALLKDEPRNTISAVGHSPQIGAFLPLYLPSNGALLAAVSLMIRTDTATLAGFPADRWVVHHEGFVPWP